MKVQCRWLGRFVVAIVLAGCSLDPVPGAEPDIGVDGAPREDAAKKTTRNEPTAPKAAQAPECPDQRHVAGTPGCLTLEAFDEGVVRLYELTVDDGDLARMVVLARNEETESTYVPAQLLIDRENVGMVGLRFKGAYGTLQSCFGEDGELLCDKLSYKVKFDEFDEDKRWQALKKVNLHSMRVDRTLMHERLAYRLFRDMGIAAPRSTYAQVRINGENKGVFTLTEAPDGRFTADRFAPSGDGNLYKEVWPTATQADAYAQQLETNRDEVPNHQPFIAFARALQRSAAADLPEVVDRFVDTDYLLRYMAVDRLISNWDGVTSFYCWSPEPEHVCENHNLYWYVDEAGERFWLVPWDLDTTWSLHTVHETIMPPWNVVPTNCQERVDWNGGWLMPPGCDPLFRGLGGLGAAAYRKAVAEVLDGPFRVDELHAEIKRMVALLTPAVRTDPTLDIRTWQADVQELEKVVVWLREKAELIRDGKDTSAMGLRLNARNDFEDGVPEVLFAMGSDLDPNPETIASRSLNKQAPIRGTADARVSFVYRTGGTMYPWLNFWLSFRAAPVNLNGFRSVRMTLQADQRRDVRIDLGPAPSSGDRLGWDVVAERDPRTVTLNFADLRSAAGSVEGLMFQVNPIGLNDQGFFPAAGSDEGYLQIDDIEFIAD